MRGIQRATATGKGFRRSAPPDHDLLGGLQRSGRGALEVGGDVDELPLRPARPMHLMRPVAASGGVMTKTFQGKDAPQDT